MLIHEIHEIKGEEKGSITFYVCDLNKGKFAPVLIHNIYEKYILVTIHKFSILGYMQNDTFNHTHIKIIFMHVNVATQILNK